MLKVIKYLKEQNVKYIYDSKNYDLTSAFDDIEFSVCGYTRPCSDRIIGYLLTSNVDRSQKMIGTQTAVVENLKTLKRISEKAKPVK